MGVRESGMDAEFPKRETLLRRRRIKMNLQGLLQMIRYTVLVIFLFLSCFYSKAQDSTVHQNNTGAVLHEKLKTVDKVHTSLDSVSGKKQIDSLEQVKKSLKFHQQDSIQQKLSANQKKLTTVTDSLGQLTNVPQRKIDGIADKLTSPADTVKQKLVRATEKANGSIDKIEQKISDTSSGLSDKIEDKTANLQQKIQDKISDKTTAGENLPQQDLNLPNADAKLPKVNMPDVNSTDVKLPDTDATSELNIPGVESDKLKLPENPLEKNAGIDGKLDVPKPDELNKITDKATGLGDKAGEYQDELVKIKEKAKVPDSESIEGSVEKQAQNIDQLKEANGELLKVSQEQAKYDAMVQQYRDKKLIQEEMIRKSKNIANDKLKEFAPQMEKAKEQLAKARKPTLKKSVTQFFKKHENQMKERKFYERLVPAITIQSTRGEQVTLDLGVQVSYSLTQRLSAGLGGVYRARLSEENKYFIAKGGVYGGRFLIEFTMMKGLYVHAEAEHLKIRPYAFGLQTETQSDFAWSGNFGLGKRFNVSRKVKGTILGLYRMEYEGKLPPASKINVRLGFEYDLHKKKRRY
jgi:hypothetical protein